MNNLGNFIPACGGAEKPFKTSFCDYILFAIFLATMLFLLSLPTINLI